MTKKTCAACDYPLDPKSTIEVKIGDTTIVAAHSRAPVGAGNPYVEVFSDVFTASATELLLSILKSNPNGGDTTRHDR